MEIADARDAYGATEILRKFLDETAHNEDNPDERSLASRLCAVTLELFREIVKAFCHVERRLFARPAILSLERSCSRFQLWSDGYGVAKGDLDDTLARSREIRRATLKLLRSIGTTLSNRLLPQLADGSVERSSETFTYLLLQMNTLYERIDDDGDSSSSDESSNFGDDSIGEIIEDLQTDITCLMELDPLFQSPVLDILKGDELPATQHDVIEWAPYRAYCDKVQSRFSQAAESLILRLGQVNYERYLKCQRERDLHERGATSNEDGSALLLLAMKSTIGESRFHDSGLGSSKPNTSSYAETIMSYGAGDGRSVRIPPLPSEAKAGKPFPCIACGALVLISNNSAWKQHLYADLCPWLCLDTTCSHGDELFKNKSDWISHLALDHALEPQWKSFECPLCRSNTGDGKIAITKHLGGHLEEISLTALPSGLDSESDSESASQDDEDRHLNAPTDPKHDADANIPLATSVEKGERPKSSPSLATDSQFILRDVLPEEEEYTIKCVCSFSTDDGHTIFCETCDTWQHVKCYYPDNVRDAESELFTHSCVDCTPRSINHERARERMAMYYGSISTAAKQDRTSVATAEDSNTKPPIGVIDAHTSEVVEQPDTLLSTHSFDPARSQPILNDSLAYLDQIKVQYHEKPHVYKNFLDIMADFKNKTIDVRTVIDRVVKLLGDEPNLIAGFSNFLPIGYRIEGPLDNRGQIVVTTPEVVIRYGPCDNQTGQDGTTIQRI